VLRCFNYKVARKKGGQIAKVATARKLLEWSYNILKDGKTFHEVKKIAECLGRGEPANCPGLLGR
jgi:hypothetical protein